MTTVPWSVDEQRELDEALRATLSLGGKERWRRIAERVSGRDARECLDRYRVVRAALLEKKETPAPSVDRSPEPPAETPREPEKPREPENLPAPPAEKPGLSVIVPKRRPAQPLAPPPARFAPAPMAAPQALPDVGALPARIRARQDPPRQVPKIEAKERAPTVVVAPAEVAAMRVPKRATQKKPQRAAYAQALDPTRHPAIQAHLYGTDASIDDAAFFWGDDEPPKRQPARPSWGAAGPLPPGIRQRDKKKENTTQAPPKKNEGGSGGGKKKKKSNNLKGLAMTFK